MIPDLFLHAATEWCVSTPRRLLTILALLCAAALIGETWI